MELARWTICHRAAGADRLQQGAAQDRPSRLDQPALGRDGASKILQLGGIVGGTAVAFSILLPIGGDPLGTTSLAIWTSSSSSRASRSLLEPLLADRAGRVLAGRGVLARDDPDRVRAALHARAATPLAISLGGLTFALPAERSARPSPCSASPAWGPTRSPSTPTGASRRAMRAGRARTTAARPGCAAPRLDPRDVQGRRRSPWCIYTFGTLAFFIMGAAVLHPQGLVPRGNEMITTLSRMYTDTLGDVGDSPVPGRRDRRARLDACGRPCRAGRGCTRTSSRRLVSSTGSNPVRLRWIRGSPWPCRSSGALVYLLL